MLRRRAVVIGTVAGLLLLPAAVGAQESDPQVVVEAARQVTTSASPTRLFVSPQIAVHPDDPSTVVMAVGDARAGGCGLHVTRDGGLSWAMTAGNLLPDGFVHCVHRNFGNYITPAFASDGTLYVGFSGSQSPSNESNVPISGFVARSTDLGATFETFTAAEGGTVEFVAEDGEAQGETQEGVDNYRYNALAVDPTDPDRVYTGWRYTVDEVEGSSNRTTVAVSSDGGETWGAPIDLTSDVDGEPADGGDIPSIAVGPDGTAYVFTRERVESDEDVASPLLMWTSTDGGETWTGTRISEGALEIDTPVGAVDPSSGDLYLAYASRGDSDENPSQIYVMSSSDGGATWSDPVNIGDAGESSSYNKYFPGISVAPSGRVDVAWFDFRNDPFFAPGGQAGGMGSVEGERWWDIYTSSSTDGGSTWTPNTRVTDRSVDGQVGVTFKNNDIRAPIGVASTNGALYAAWADSRAGDLAFEAEDAYFTRIRFADAGAGTTAAATAGDDRVLWTLVGAAAALAVGGLVLVLGTRMARGAPAAAGQRARSRSDR